MQRIKIAKEYSVTTQTPLRTTIPDPTTEPTMSADRAARVLGVSGRSIYLACDRGEIPCIRVGRSVRIPTARFLAQFRFLTDAD
jgi:excisionase family DNA binding protein